MSSTVVIGAQWGDEGKGKIVDYLADRADLVVRYQGGNNAGHTVVVGEEKFKLHLIPSGILYRGKKCLLGNGVVIDLPELVGELERLEERNIDTRNLFISNRAHLILPYHQEQDRKEEEKRGGGRIGTTGKGIGPAYRDKVNRVGIRVLDLYHPEKFRKTLEGKGVENIDEIVSSHTKAFERIRPQVVDGSCVIDESIQKGDNVLFEGAQGTLLDLDHGTYPFVTSSNPIAGGVCIGAGVGPTKIDQVIGVAKAYTTRVGEGPFPSELEDETGEKLRKEGNEFGTTTGRPRRCGWLDLVILRYAARVNGLSSLAITKIDVLDHFSSLSIVTSYRDGDREYRDFPADPEVLRRCKPVIETFSGWNCSVDEVSRYEELPEKLKEYILRIEKATGLSVSMVSTGPQRKRLIVRNQGKV